ncbi:hypothetical protein COB72_01910 [bacterium]|nr:MAG: hypothetical protein COB72_01910 [bacterium]
MSAFRSDAIGTSTDGNSAAGVLKGICGSAAGFRSDGGPCMCCGCTPSGSPYRFDRSYMWREGFRIAVNTPAEYFQRFSAGFDQVSTWVTTEELGDNNDERWRVEARLQDVLFTRALGNSTVGGESQFANLFDRSYDEHCGFGTGARDLDDAADWDGTGAEHDSPVDRGIRDGVLLADVYKLDGSHPEHPGFGLVEFRRLTAPAFTIELPLKEIGYSIEFRIIADSRGHHEDREGMIERMRGQHSYQSGTDKYAPCILIEAKLSLRRPVYDFARFTTEHQAFYDNNLSLVTSGHSGEQHLAPVNPAGHPSIHDHFDAVGQVPSNANRSVVLAAATLKNYLASGEYRATAYIGEMASNAANGLGGYPPADVFASVFDSTSDGSFLMTTHLDGGSQMDLSSSIWVRDAEIIFNPMSASFFLLDGVSRVAEYTKMRSMSLSLELGESMLRPLGSEWTPSLDHVTNELDARRVSIYRRCGTVCGDDVFGPHTPGPVVPFGIVHQNQVYGLVGHTLLNAVHPDFIESPNYTGPDNDESCGLNAMAVACVPRAGLAPIRFRIDPSFVEGGTTMVPDDTGGGGGPGGPGGGDFVRYKHVLGSTHSDINAPELIWVDQLCDGAVDARIATLCPFMAANNTTPLTVIYDRGQMTDGSLTYIVGLAGQEIPYLLTNSIAIGEIEPGSFSDEPCPEPSRIAHKCDDGSVSVRYRLSDKPDDGVTFLYNGDRYLPTPVLVSGPPVDVSELEWTTDECENLGVWYKAVRCSNGTGPPGGEYRYQLNEHVGIGNGAVLVSTSTVNNDQTLCVVTFAVQPTGALADGTEHPGRQIFGDCRSIVGASSGCHSQPDDPIDPNGQAIRTPGGLGNPALNPALASFLAQFDCVGCGG